MKRANSKPLWGKILSIILVGLLSFSSLAVIPKYAFAEESEESSDMSTDVACSTAAGGMGWVICTVLEWLTSAISGLYSWVVDNSLSIETELISTTGETNGTYQGWTYFRDFANIAFVIFFMVVVISQLTGYGIDNYGIKRSLPRLVIAAILVNLSFILCQICVDLSNIIGQSIMGLFTNLAEGIQFSGSVAGVSNGTIVAASIGGGAVGILGVVGIGALLIRTGAMVPALGGLFGTVLMATISIFFLALLLALRKGILIIGIVIAPLAFTCYILPNTKSIFDRWLKIMEGMLMLYPICSVVIGGGLLGSKIILSTGGGDAGVWTIIVAMLVQVGPYLFVPTLIQGAFKAAGNIGATINSFGNRTARKVNGATRRTVMGTTFARRIEAQRSFKRQEKLNEAIQKSKEKENSGLRQKITKLENEEANGGLSNKKAKKLDKYTRRLANNNQFLKRQDQENTAARTMLREEEFGNLTMGEITNRWDTAFNEGNERELEAITNVGISRYGSAFAGQIGQRLNTKTGIQNNQNYQRSLTKLQDMQSHNSSFANVMQNKAADAFEMIGNRGIIEYQRDATGNIINDPRTGSPVPIYGDLSHFSANNNTATSIKDWATQSTATLQRAIDSGALDNDTIREILTSDDPAIRSGIQSDRGKRQVLEAQLYNSDPNHANALPPNIASQRYRAEQQTHANTQATIQATENAIRAEGVQAPTRIRYIDRTTGTARNSLESVYRLPHEFNATLPTGYGRNTTVEKTAEGHFVYTQTITDASGAIVQRRRYDASNARILE